MGKLERRKLLGLAILGIIIILIFILRSQVAQDYLKPYFSLNRRVTYWQQTFNIIKAHPLLGGGLGNFNLALSRYAHNLFLQLWAEMGIFGIFTFIWFIIVHLKYALNNIRESPNKNRIASLLKRQYCFPNPQPHRFHLLSSRDLPLMVGNFRFKYRSR